MRGSKTNPKMNATHHPIRIITIIYQGIDARLILFSITALKYIPAAIQGPLKTNAIGMIARSAIKINTRTR